MVDVESEVRSIIARLTKVPQETLRPDTNLVSELNVDSLLGLQIMAALEKQFGVSIPDEELDSYTTVRMIVDTVKKLHPAA